MDDEGKILADKMERARLALSWEMFWRLAWPLPAWTALFAGLALLDLLPLLSPWLHRALLLGFAVGLAALAARLRHFRLPDRTQCQRRLEQDSALPHRPLALLDDRLPEQASPLTAALWQVERARALAAIRRLRLKPPAPALAALDPWGLRFAALLVLAVGLAVGAGDAPARLERALDPDFGDGTLPPVLQVWITPPRYTGMSPILLPSIGATAPLAVPQGSALLAELQGAGRAARLEIDDISLPFDRLDPDSQKLETTLQTGRRLRVRLGWHGLGQWAITVVPDQPPQVAFVEPPKALPDGKLRVRIAASDDYGVEQLALDLHRLDAAEDDSEIALEAAGQKQLMVDQSLDLASHPWSGLRVTLRPVAEDGAGHRETGAAVTLRLPEREFHHPVARALADLRRALAADAGQRAQTVKSLEALAGQPDQFNDDTVVFLQITTARSRLIRDRGPQAIPSSLDMLWAAAIRIEDGDLPDARDAVDQASQALRDALAKGASDDDITRLTADLQRAVQRLMASLRKQAGQSAGRTANAAGRALSEEQLAAMLGQLSDLAHAGARQAAQQSLRALQDLLDNLTPGGGADPSAAQLSAGLQALQRLTEAQRGLLDHSFRRDRQSANGRTEELKNQSSVERSLQQLIQSLPDRGQAPALGQALQAMSQALSALRADRPDQTTAAQSLAVDKLQEGARQVSQALEQAEQQGALGESQDPLGRGVGAGSAGGAGVKLPSQGDLGKAREILDELRRRAAEAERPAAERDYLHRLLDRLY